MYRRNLHATAGPRNTEGEPLVAPQTACDNAGMTDFRPSASWNNLRLRAALLRRLRDFFEDRGYLEVETPLASADTVIDRHLDPFTTVLSPDPRRPAEGKTLYLQTSPELCMKRLLAAGAPAIYQVVRSFRNGESGRLHNPEFTLIEWYRPGDGMAEQMRELEELCRAILEKPVEGLPTTGPKLAWPAERMTYQQAFERHLGVNPHRTSVAELKQAAAERNPSAELPALGDDRDVWLDYLLTEIIEPHLGHGRATILYEYPASQAALARVRQDRPDQPAVAERFEIYIESIELANGYHELLDANLLRARNVSQNELRVADGKMALPPESRLLEAMDAGLPACAGVALGFDRLVMLAAGAKSLAEVLAFPIDRA